MKEKRKRTKLEALVYDYKTESEYGFTNVELKTLLVDFPDIDMDKFNNAMMGNTCMVNDRKEIINYYCDVLTALRCGIEKREMHWYEWD